MEATARKKILHRIADGIVARAEEIALAECWDTGQALRFMSKAALRGAENFRFFADKATSARDGQHLPSPTLMNITTRVPIGPVGDHHAVEHALHAVHMEDRARAWPPAAPSCTNRPSSAPSPPAS
jgi:acyl-CoA reductase-like NAD-dependent aldehyde dehydrogenase